MIYYDTETCGLHGMIVTIQYAKDEEDVIIHEVWKKPIIETLNLIEMFMDEGTIGFNLAFDHFHLNKIYNVFKYCLDKRVLTSYALPIDSIHLIKKIEAEARDGLCLKPRHAFDVMLHARKGPYQSTMDRGDIRIKKVPTLLSIPLAEELEKRIKLKDIYFARKKNKYAQRWNIMNTDDPDFKDIVLKFHPTNALKALAVDALGIEDVLLHGDISLDKYFYPEEVGWAPFWPHNTWPDKITHHIEHWSTNNLARRYGKDDVLYTRSLYNYFNCPPVDDNDSTLACLVGSVRWKGFAIDIEGIKKLKQEAEEKSKSAPTAPNAVREYICSRLSDTERVILQQGSKLEETTKKVVLEDISEFTQECDCIDSFQRFDNTTILAERLISNPKCPKCNGSGKIFHPAALLARDVLEARMAKYEINFYDKLLQAGRLHADFNIIGTLSSRMSGSSGLNTQGIKKSKNVRSCFPLAFPPYILCGGDFISFEVVLADAQYNDPWLRKQLLTIIDCPFCDGSGCKECNGSGKHKQTIHGLFGTFVYPGMSYKEILLTKGTADDKYTRAKSAVFTMLYGGTDHSLKERLGISVEAAQNGFSMFTNQARKLGDDRRKICEMFQAMRQPGGIGSKVEWHEPKDYIESMFGFRRYFTLENKICKALFELAEKPPKAWTEIKIKVQRRDREQSVSGAVRSALFAAAFNLQGQNTRAAINHVIQSSGATLTKSLQCKIWDLQPFGINEWVVIPMNIHDEILDATHPDYVEKLTQIVEQFIQDNKSKIPLLDIDWKVKMKSWAEK